MTRGPVPNRSEDLARPRSRKGGDTGPEVKTGEMRPVVIPEADPEWHEIAKMIWEALRTSGQQDFYQNTDWVYAYSLCEDITRYKEGRVNQETGELYFKRSPEMLKALMSGMSNLLMTEADRRRARVELSQPEPEEAPAAVLAIADYKDALDAPAEEDETSA
jgi:hypothetical protein